VERQRGVSQSAKMSGKTKKKLKLVRREEDPVVCIQKFYQFLELHLKHRVKAKMGSTLKVDHMTMRHITKSSQVRQSFQLSFFLLSLFY
jgi:hypothetical protein